MPRKSDLRLLWWSSKTINSTLGNLGCSFKGLQGIFSLMYNIKPPPNRFRSHLNCLNPAIWNWFNGNMQSNFDSEIRKISKALIIFSTKTNLFLKELIFRWMANYSIPSIVNSLFTNTQNVVIYRTARFRVFWRKRTMTSSKQIMLVLQSNWFKVV